MSKTNAKTTESAVVDPIPAVPGRVTKIDIVVGLLRRPEGADVTALAEATGWQLHSVRGAIAGHIKKKLGLAVATRKIDGKTVYRIEG
jgi:hypothetical protein